MGFSAASCEIVLLISFLVTGTRGYGLDCSFPIHNQTFGEDCDGLEGRRQIYETFMVGCSSRYGFAACKSEEQKRLKMNRDQPLSMINYTMNGYRKVRAPPALQKLLSEFWEINKEDAVDEEWPYGSIFTNHWEVPTKFVNVADEDFIGGGGDLMDEIWDVAQAEVEDWTGIKMRPSSVYGIRVYSGGSMLSPHVDRIPLISSCIVNVAQDLDEDWPLEVYDRSGQAMNITMQPFDMVFYESHSLIHGRPYALKGRYYANIFIHFEATGEALQGDGHSEFPADNGLLPPYILANTPIAKEWLDEHPLGWSKALHEDDAPWLIAYAGNGNLGELKEYLDIDPRLVNYTDDDGLQPLHAAVLGGQFQTVKFLIDQGADINRLGGDNDLRSPLNLAKTYLWPRHPITFALLQLGAEDIYEEVDQEEVDEDEDEDFYADDEEDDDDLRIDYEDDEDDDDLRIDSEDDEDKDDDGEHDEDLRIDGEDDEDKDDDDEHDDDLRIDGEDDEDKDDDDDLRIDDEDDKNKDDDDEDDDSTTDNEF